MSKTDIKSYEIRLLSAETDTSLMYVGENSNILGVLYFFENSAYYICECIIPAIQVGLLSNYLLERYSVVSSEEGIVIMLSPDEQTVVALMAISASYYVVIYFDGSNFKGSSGLKSNSYRSGLFRLIE